jgi:hypothetical protein
VGGLVTAILYYYQSKDEIRRSKILNEIDNINKVQERIHLSVIRGPLIGISIEIGELRNRLKEGLDTIEDHINKLSDNELNYKYELLQYFLNKNKGQFESDSETLHIEANHIRSFIGEIYQEIITTLSYLRDSITISEPNTDAKREIKLQIIKKWINDCKIAIHESDIQLLIVE